MNRDLSNTNAFLLNFLFERERVIEFLQFKKYLREDEYVFLSTGHRDSELDINYLDVEKQIFAGHIISLDFLKKKKREPEYFHSCSNSPFPLEPLMPETFRHRATSHLFVELRNLTVEEIDKWIFQIRKLHSLTFHEYLEKRNLLLAESAGQAKKV